MGYSVHVIIFPVLSRRHPCKLLEYLDKMDRINIKQYCELQKLSRRHAQRILVNMVLSGVIRIHTTEKEEYYTAA